MVSVAAFHAAALYLAPLIAFAVLRFSRERPAWVIALDLPFAVSLDLLGVLLLTRIVTLEVAVLVSRPLWAILLTASAIRRRRRGDFVVWPKTLSAKTIVTLVVA